ncbi:hypothetical protein JNW90_13660 [Micromonospora sp. STR1s_5]|nr:hypothetical protein [Micromonospora sp. STR1s_5]
MAFDLTTGPGLVQAVAKTLIREDLLDEPGLIASWVRMAETQLQTSLRLNRMVKRSTATISDAYTVLPPDLLEIKSIHINTPSGYQRYLGYAAPEDLQDIRRSFPNGGAPEKFSIIGTQIELGPDPVESAQIELTYYAALPALDCTTPGATNWLLQLAPHLYLYSTLCNSAPFLQEDERLQVWLPLAQQALTSLNEADYKSTYGGSRLTMKGRTFG